MDKISYIRLSYRDANKKIWDSLIEKYKAVKKKNSLLGYLWVTVASIAFGFVAVISWFSFIGLFFRDVRFTPHYMQTVIDSNNMTAERANEYLDSQLLEYKKRLSYGNVSPKERNSIDTTFELLYATYKMPNPTAIDGKHEVIISNLSEIYQSVTKVNCTINEVVDNMDNIVAYTNKKQIEEEIEENRIEELQNSADERFVTAYNRQRGRMLTSFLSKLSDKQLDILTDYCNRIPVFNRDIEKDEIKKILLCVHKEPLKVKNNKYIALLFTRLGEEQFICSTWKAVATRYACFTSIKGKPLNTNDLYMGNQTSGIMESYTYDLIEECINKILEKK